MDRMIACCGISCNECPALLATRNRDDEAREKISKEWSKAYGADLKPDDINCKGCLSATEPQFQYCKVCEIRKCAREKEILNCAYCDDYACEKLEKFFKMAPEAKITLDVIHEEL